MNLHFMQRTMDILFLACKCTCADDVADGNIHTSYCRRFLVLNEVTVLLENFTIVLIIPYLGMGKLRGLCTFTTAAANVDQCHFVLANKSAAAH